MGARKVGGRHLNMGIKEALEFRPNKAFDILNINVV